MIVVCKKEKNVYVEPYDNPKNRFLVGNFYNYELSKFDRLGKRFNVYFSGACFIRMTQLEFDEYFTDLRRYERKLKLKKLEEYV